MKVSGNDVRLVIGNGRATHRNLTVWAVIAAMLLISPLLFAQEPPQTPDKEDSAKLLSLDLESLFNVKVTTASKFSESLSDAPGVMSVISRDELKRFGAVTLREILERVPGLTGTSAYFTDRSMVAARGDQTKIDGGHILILINGRPTREVLEGGIISDLLEAFPVSVLDRIEVIKGPGSVLYGSNAFSAVVNLITQKSTSNGLILSGAGGNEGALSTSGQAMLTHGAFNAIGAVQVHREPDWSTSYRFPFVDPFGPPQGTTAVQNIRLRNHSAGSYASASYKNLTLMSSFTEFHGGTFVRGAVGENRWRRGFGDIGYAFKVSNHWDSSINLTYTRTTLDVPDYPYIGRDSNEITAEWTNALSISLKDRLTFGTLYNHISGQETYFGISPSIPISVGTRSGGALYGQLDHQLLPEVKLIGGFQANKVGSIDLNVVPRAGVIWNPSTHVNVKVLYSKAFRAPSINETRLNHPSLAGNPDLRPEQVGTFDIGTTYQGRRVRAGVNYFRSRQTDSIVIDFSTPRWVYANLGVATFQGVEFEGKYYFSKHFLLEGSTLYQANEDGNGKKNITPVANFGAKAGVSYESQDGFIVSLFDNYQGHLDYPATVNPQPGAYHLMNLHARWDLSKFTSKFEKGKVALFVHGDNLINKQVWMPDLGGNSGDSIAVNRGRTVYFGVEVAVLSKK